MTNCQLFPLCHRGVLLCQEPLHWRCVLLSFHFWTEQLQATIWNCITPRSHWRARVFLQAPIMEESIGAKANPLKLPSVATALKWQCYWSTSSGILCFLMFLYSDVLLPEVKTKAQGTLKYCSILVLINKQTEVSNITWKKKLIMIKLNVSDTFTS